MTDRTLTYAEYAAEAKNCDLALWKPTSYWSRWVARVTGGPYSHVTGIVNWPNVGRWFSCGYEERRGGIAEPLDVMAKRYPGVIDVYRVRESVFAECGATRECVAANLGANLGWPYAWRAIRLLAAPWLPVIGLFVTSQAFERIVSEVSASKREGICSQHVARSFEDCGIQLVRKPSARVTPNDLSQSFAMDYIGTLVE